MLALGLMPRGEGGGGGSGYEVVGEGQPVRLSDFCSGRVGVRVNGAWDRKDEGMAGHVQLRFRASLKGQDMVDARSTDGLELCVQVPVSRKLQLLHELVGRMRVKFKKLTLKFAFLQGREGGGNLEVALSTCYRRLVLEQGGHVGAGGGRGRQKSLQIDGKTGGGAADGMDAEGQVEARRDVSGDASSGGGPVEVKRRASGDVSGGRSHVGPMSGAGGPPEEYQQLPRDPMEASVIHGGGVSKGCRAISASGNRTGGRMRMPGSTAASGVRGRMDSDGEVAEDADAIVPVEVHEAAVGGAGAAAGASTHVGGSTAAGGGRAGNEGGGPVAV